MSISSDLFDQVLSLPADQRAALAQKLLLSLESETPQADWQQLWGAEIDRRIRAIESGEMSTVEWSESLTRMRASLKELRQ